MPKILSSTAGVLVAAFLVRAAALVWGSDSLAEDPDSYARLAVQWSESGVFGFESADGHGVRPTAFRPPLYPWLLSFLVADGQVGREGVALLHLVLGLASVWLTLSIGRRLQLPCAALAAVAVALDPILLRASQLIMTETLATFAAVVAWRVWLGAVPQGAEDVKDCCLRERFSVRPWLLKGLLGVILGLSILARPTAAPWAALCLVSLAVAGAAGWKRRLAGSLIAGLGVLVCLSPWTLRNATQLGKPIWATTHGGYTLLLANNPTLFQHFMNNGPSRAWNAEPFHAAWAARHAHQPSELLEADYWLNTSVDRGVVAPEPRRVADELTDDALAYSAARATIDRQPGLFLVGSLIRIGWLWALWPNESAHALQTWAIGGWYFAWFVLAVAGGWRLLPSSRWRGWLPGLLLIVSLTAIHAVFWSNMRMRSPAMPVVYLLAIRTLCNDSTGDRCGADACSGSGTPASPTFAKSRCQFTLGSVNSEVLRKWLSPIGRAFSKYKVWR